MRTSVHEHVAPCV